MPRLRTALNTLGWSLVLLPVAGIVVSLYVMAICVAVSWWADGYYGSVGLLVAVVMFLTGGATVTMIAEFWREPHHRVEK